MKGLAKIGTWDASRLETLVGLITVVEISFFISTRHSPASGPRIGAGRNAVWRLAVRVVILCRALPEQESLGTKLVLNPSEDQGASKESQHALVMLVACIAEQEDVGTPANLDSQEINQVNLSARKLRDLLLGTNLVRVRL
jgi:hypothetical protein